MFISVVFLLLWSKKWYIMLGKVPEITQRDMYRTGNLLQIIFQLFFPKNLWYYVD